MYSFSHVSTTNKKPQNYGNKLGFYRMPTGIYRHLMGETLSAMNVKELKQLETRLEKGISRIRSKKNELLFAEIEYMQKREIDLQNSNMYLRAKISENERAQQNMNVLPAHEYEVMPAFDSRNFLHVNLLEPHHGYSNHEQTALHLG
ncbi:AGAMOUS-like protein transcription factor [Cinnamomum micranthum f. kanehirae]|uniref:AGAMOUS-like protein transcription factor n=1 Tax=Cinnamomum micranthum f. kanehirae TaxID=337451 RepID=A0A3S3R6W2_9MAGN|nr:AGAMOUS-like protein transcription factor [Cinnamomum micranthum f. kanehirae]